MYDYSCPECGERLDIWAKPDDKTLYCELCGSLMKRQLHAQYGISMGGVPTGGYYDDTLGAHIETQAQKRRLMKEQGVTLKGDTPKPDGEAWV